MDGERAARACDERLIFSANADPAQTPPVPAGPEQAVAAQAPSRRLVNALAASPFRERISAALELEGERGAGFVLVPAGLAAGAVIYFCLPYEPPPGLMLVLVALAALAAAGLRGAPIRQAVALAAAVTICGMLAGALETWRHSTLMLGSSISTRITGRVVAVEHRANGRLRLTIDLISTERPELRHAPARIRATSGEIPAGIGPGDGVTGVVRLMSASGPQRPFGYDFAFRSFFDGIGANGFFLSGPFRAEIPAPANWTTGVAAWVERQRLRIAANIRARIGGAAEGEVAAALVTGVRAGIPEDVTEALRATGLAHFISISGLHMALVAGTVVGAMRAAFALFPGFASRRAVKKYAAACGLVALVAYLALSGGEVAAQRSFIMFAVMLIAVLFDRAALTMRNLAISALIILVITPHEVMGPSFQMSFAATMALIGAYGWYSERRMRRSARTVAQRSALGGTARLVLLFFGGLAMTSLIAGFATGLFAVWHFQRIAPLGLIANLAAMPIVTIAVMPLAVAGVLTMPLGIDGLFFAGMGKALALVIAIASGLAERSPVDVVGAIPAEAVAVLTIALVIATAATTWLRLAALPFLAAGLTMVALRDMPDVLISEDARLVAMPLEDGSLSVNRSRPSAFTLEMWEAALRTRGVVKPRKAEKGLPVPGAESAFVCGEGLCAARHSSGAIVAFAETADAAAPACRYSAVLVIDDATAENVCAGRTPIVLTKRDLAWRGSAAVRFAPDGPKISYAITETLRPWHDHRRWSREARGMPPWRRQPKTGDDQ